MARRSVGGRLRNGAELWRRLKPVASRARCGWWANGRPQTSGRKGRCRKPSADPVRQNDRSSHDDGPDTLSKAETVTVAAIEAGVPTLVEAREIIAEFHMMIRHKAIAGLTPGSSAPEPAWLRRSEAASPRMKPPSGQQLLCLGRTDRPKVRLPASSSSDGKCTAAAKSICFRPD